MELACFMLVALSRNWFTRWVEVSSKVALDQRWYILQSEAYTD
jgi:hypothetical protein